MRKILFKKIKGLIGDSDVSGVLKNVIILVLPSVKKACSLWFLLTLPSEWLQLVTLDPTRMTGLYRQESDVDPLCLPVSYTHTKIPGKVVTFAKQFSCRPFTRLLILKGSLPSPKESMTSIVVVWFISHV